MYFIALMLFIAGFIVLFTTGGSIWATAILALGSTVLGGSIGYSLWKHISPLVRAEHVVWIIWSTGIFGFIALLLS